MSKAVKAGKSEAEVLEALAQSQLTHLPAQHDTSAQVAAAIASVQPRTAMRERNPRSKTPQQVG